MRLDIDPEVLPLFMLLFIAAKKKSHAKALLTTGKFSLLPVLRT